MTISRWIYRLCALAGLCLLAEAAMGQPVFISEIHYDDADLDDDEGVEVAGPAGTSLGSWQLWAYNGANGTSYGLANLSGTIPDEGNGFGAIFFPITGLQNSAPGGIALVNNGVLVQFLSYEGAFVGTAGPANGVLSQDIGVSENTSTPEGYSLQLIGTGSQYSHFTWSGPSPHSRGSINAGMTLTNGPLGTYTYGPSTLEALLADATLDPLPIIVSTVITATSGTVAIDSITLGSELEWGVTPGNPTTIAAGTTATLSFTFTPTVNAGLSYGTTAHVVTSASSPSSFTLALNGSTVLETTIFSFRSMVQSGFPAPTVLKVVGTVNSNNLIAGGNGFAFQELTDGDVMTRGIIAYDSTGAFINSSTLPDVGDRVAVYGLPAVNNGSVEMVPSRPFNVISTGGTIIPVATDGSALGDDHESVLVVVDDAIVPPGAYGPGAMDLTVTDESASTFTLRIQPGAGISYVGLDIPLPMTGVVGQSDAGNPLSGGIGYYLQPRSSSEVPVELSSFGVD